MPRVDDWRVLYRIFWRLRTGAPWADIPERYGPHTTCVNRYRNLVERFLNKLKHFRAIATRYGKCKVLRDGRR